MKSQKPMRLEDVELVPDAMERLEGAVKHAATHNPPQRKNPGKQPSRPRTYTNIPRRTTRRGRRP
jgi:hypothetical protein